jgi:hypothetical protein
MGGNGRGSIRSYISTVVWKYCGIPRETSIGIAGFWCQDSKNRPLEYELRATFGGTK